MMISSPRIGFVLLAVLLPAPGATLRRECYNRSGRDWRLTLVEGVQPGAGRLNIIDTFTGGSIGTLARTGDSVALPAGARYLMEFASEHQSCCRYLLVQDSRGNYAEFLVSVPFRNDPAPVLTFQDRHVGPPLDRAADETVLRRIEDAIATDDGNLIIRQDCICQAEPAGG